MNIKKIFMFLLLPAIIFSLHGCILDSLEVESVKQTFPYTVEYKIESDGLNPFEKESQFSLDNVSHLNQYKNKIKEIKIISLTYKTKSATPENLQADVYFEVKGSKDLMFKRQFNDLNIDDYKTKTLNFELKPDEINKVSKYLAKLNNKTIDTKIIVSDVKSGNQPIVVEGIFTFDFEMEADK